MARLCRSIIKSRNDKADLFGVAVASVQVLIGAGCLVVQTAARNRIMVFPITGTNAGFDDCNMKDS
jgi:hypothetical protein